MVSTSHSCTSCDSTVDSAAAEPGQFRVSSSLLFFIYILILFELQCKCPKEFYWIKWPISCVASTFRKSCSNQFVTTSNRKKKKKKKTHSIIIIIKWEKNSIIFCSAINSTKSKLIYYFIKFEIVCEIPIKLPFMAFTINTVMHTYTAHQLPLLLHIILNKHHTLSQPLWAQISPYMCFSLRRKETKKYINWIEK